MPAPRREVGDRGPREPALAALLAAVGAAGHGPCSQAIERAYAVASAFHQGQLRRSGEPYITHPLAVALILAELGQGPPVVCAALLHDVLEDTGCTLAALRRDFDPEVIDLVDQVTRLDKLDGTACRSLAGPPAASRSIDDSPALAIKLADRLHNMRTLQYLAPAKQEQKSREVLTAFAPLARSLGMDAMERELVDLAAAVLNGPRDDPASGVPAGRARPGRLSRRLLATTVVLLPAADRERWLEEWTAELGTLPSRGNRARLTIEMLVGMPRLAAALRWPVRTARAD